MTELIKLINKDFFPNLKSPLNEAGGLNSGNANLPDPNDQTILANIEGRPNDEQWNVLYRKYLNPSDLKFYLITVQGFQRKTPIQGEPASGFLKFVGQTQSKEGKANIFSRKTMLDTVESKDISIVENPDDATIFAAQDTQKIIDAIKRNSDFVSRGTKFGYRNATMEQLANVDYASLILLKYFQALCGKDYSGEIRSALATLNTICRQRQKPLSGNSLFDMLKSILDNPDSEVIINGNAVILLNNLIADRVFASRDIISPNTFKAALTYNRTFYRFSITQIKELFEAYGKLLQFDTSKSNNTRIREMEAKQIARHCLIDTGNGTDADPFEAILRQMEGFEKVDLPTIGFKPEGDLIRTWSIRTPEQVTELTKMLNADSEKGEGSETNTNLVLNTVNPSGDNTPYDLKNIQVDEEDIKGEFVNVTVTKGTKLSVHIRGNAGLSKNLIPALGENYFKDNEFVELDKSGFLIAKDNFSSTIEAGASAGKLTRFKITGSVSITPETEEEEEQETETTTPTESVPEGYEEIDPDGTTVGDEQQDVTVQVGDKVVGLDGNRLDVTAENIGAGKWNIKAGTKIWRLKPEPAAEPSSTGEAFVGGKTLDDISKMSKEDFKTFSLGLTPEDKAKLKALGGKLLAAK